MKKMILVLMIFLMVSVFAFAQNSRVIEIRNETGYEINSVFFSPSAFDDWADDFLGDDVLSDGESIEVTLDREIDVDEIIYDLQAVDEDNDYYTIYEMDIEESPVVTITMDAYDGGDYGDYDDYDYGSYEEGYNEGYSEGYKQGYTEAFRDAYLEGFRAALDMDISPSAQGNNSGSTGTGGWR